jgi:hypothetical protein
VLSLGSFSSEAWCAKKMTKKEKKRKEKKISIKCFVGGKGQIK